jgi:hypothetical protein
MKTRKMRRITRRWKNSSHNIKLLKLCIRMLYPSLWNIIWVLLRRWMIWEALRTKMMKRRRKRRPNLKR